MLREPQCPSFGDVDRQVFDSLVSPEHDLRRALQTLDFERFRPLLATAYSPNLGQPADEPVRLLKLEFLQFHDNLSDWQVTERARTDEAYRFFLGLGLDATLPGPSLLSPGVSRAARGRGA